MTIEMPAAISAYSIAVAPFSSLTKREIKVRMIASHTTVDNIMGENSYKAAKAIEETATVDLLKF